MAEKRGDRFVHVEEGPGFRAESFYRCEAQADDPVAHGAFCRKCKQRVLLGRRK